jgi:hypothetical protein
MIFWTIVGIGIGYFFKPQIDKLVYKTVHMIKDNQNKKKYRDGGDDF